MTTTEREQETETKTDAGFVTRLADRGGETMHRFADEVVKQPMVSDAIGKANAARGRLERVSRFVFEQLGIAPAGEVEKLRKEVSRLERRVKKLEGGQKAAETAAKEPAAPATTAMQTPESASQTPS
jgi:polyhydroxyalkanoate synthesis regulator phasin